MILTKSTWVSAGLFLLAMVLEAFHAPRDWPFWLAWFNPLFTLLVVLFWTTEYPSQVSFGLIWFFGILLDVLYSSLLGINGLLMVAFSYIGWKFCERFISYSYFQQSAFVFIACFCYRFVYGLLVQDNLGFLFFDALISALVSAVLWPYFSILIRRLY